MLLPEPFPLLKLGVAFYCRSCLVYGLRDIYLSHFDSSIRPTQSRLSCNIGTTVRRFTSNIQQVQRVLGLSCIQTAWCVICWKAVQPALASYWSAYQLKTWSPCNALYSAVESCCSSLRWSSAAFCWPNQESTRSLARVPSAHLRRKCGIPYFRLNASHPPFCLYKIISRLAYIRIPARASDSG